MLEAILIAYITFLVTITTHMAYLHRHLAHRSVTFSKPLVALIKISRWMCLPRYSINFDVEWVAGHIQHHIHPDSKEDVHDPYDDYYHFPSYKQKPAKDKIKKSIYKRMIEDRDINQLDHILEGLPGGFYICILLAALLFSWQGALVILVMRFGHRVGGPFNVIVHTAPGYNLKKQIEGKARNVPYIAPLYCGEELHGNHHNWPNRPNFSVKWYEFDLTYVLLRLLSFVKLVTIHDSGAIDSASLTATKQGYKE